MVLIILTTFLFNLYHDPILQKEKLRCKEFKY